MALKKFLFGSLILGTGLSLIRKTFTAPVSSQPRSQSPSYDDIDAFIIREMRRLNIPGVSLAIVEGDRITHQRGFGRARPGGEAPTPQTPFFIGSITKSFTALAVMQLVEAGKVELDTPVQRYLPWFRVASPKASAQITVRHLLNQTSGIPESSGEVTRTNVDDRPDATEQRARSLASLKLAHPVGAAVEYSNTNYDLLGLIIEAASDQPYADYLQERIFSPLNMTHTFTSRAVARQSGLAMGYRYWFGIPFPASDLPIPHGSLPSGLLISSTEDLARYMIAHLNGGRFGDVSVLSSAAIDELHRGAADYRRMGISAGWYAMGWFDGEIGQTRIVWHGGTMPDYGAYMALLPQQEKGVVLLVNASHWWFNPLLSEFGMGVAALIAGEHYKPTPFSTIIPLVLRGQLLIPAFLIFDFTATLKRLRRWHLKPEHRPSGGRMGQKRFLFPLIPNLGIALTLKSVLGKRRDYLKLYMPDYFWMAMICGSFAGVWAFLRTLLIFKALKERSPLDAP
jgi:CubicO group peptidase (beta-lactamase class C family)